MTFDLLESRGDFIFPHPSWVIAGTREELLHLFNSLDSALHTFADEPVHGPIHIKIKLIDD